MKIVKVILIVLALLGLLVYLYFPWDLTERGLWEPAWWKKSLFNFCKYQVPDGYEVISYSEGPSSHRDDKYLIILKNSKTDQLIILSRLRGFHFVPFGQIQIDGRDFKESPRFESERILENFNVVTHLPVWHFLRQDDLTKLPINLLLKGITVRQKEEYSTNKANVLYFKGSFTKIGFFKKMPLPFGFATPVFDFLTPQKGVLAILNSKEGKETIIVASAVPSYKNFDEETFKTFLQSITFDKEVYKPALLEGVSPDQIKTKTKLSF